MSAVNFGRVFSGNTAIVTVSIDGEARHESIEVVGNQLKVDCRVAQFVPQGQLLLLADNCATGAIRFYSAITIKLNLLQSTISAINATFPNGMFPLLSYAVAIAAPTKGSTEPPCISGPPVHQLFRSRAL